MDSQTTDGCYSNDVTPVENVHYQNSYAHFDRHFMFLDISDDGQMLLGVGDLSGRYWSSSVHYYKEAKTPINKGNGKTVMDMGNVLSCGKILEPGKKIVVGDDVGKIFVASVEVTENDNFNIRVDLGACDHDSSVLALSLSPDKKKLVSGGMDLCIKVWDVSESLSTLYTYRPAHSHMVTDVEFAPKSDHIFASCSYDGSAVLWDTREITKPAIALKSDCDESLETCCWLEDNVLAVGSSFGNIMLIDARMKNICGHIECFNRPLHKIVKNSSGILAACGDTNVVKAFDTSLQYMKPIYTSDSHDDFVRGLAWHPKTSQLYSCGLDTKVICHNINRS